MPSSPLLQSQAVEDDHSFIVQVLRPALPYSLPLLRRIQFQQRQEVPTPRSEIRLIRSNAIQRSENEGHQHQGLWLAAHIDLTAVGQTQVWLYASWEPEFAGRESSAEAVRASSDFATYKALFAELFRHIQDHHVPHVSQDPPDQWLRLKNEGKIVSLPYSRSKVLFGTVAECLWPMLDDYRQGAEGSRVNRDDRRWLKYIISEPPKTQRAVPDGYYLDKIPDRHLQAIIDRSVIPRTLETIKQLDNVGLFGAAGTPIAWGLLSKDGSFASLHTEEEFRGRGLAIIVGQELLRKQREAFAEEDPIYSHADVGEKNVASRRVLEKLGGQVRWMSAWIELDLGQKT